MLVLARNDAQRAVNVWITCTAPSIADLTAVDACYFPLPVLWCKDVFIGCILMRALAFWSMTRCIFEYPQPKINIRRNPGLHETSKVDKPYAGLIQATAASPCLSVSNGICQLCLILPRWSVMISVVPRRAVRHCRCIFWKLSNMMCWDPLRLPAC